MSVHLTLFPLVILLHMYKYINLTPISSNNNNSHLFIPEIKKEKLRVPNIM